MPLSPELTTSTATTLTAYATSAGVVVYIALFIYAVRQLGDARSLREEQARPYVFIDFHVDDRHMIYLTIENIGKTAAGDVHFDCQPPLTSSRDELSASSNLSKPSDFISRCWPTFPPGKKVTSWFDVSHERFATDLPTQYEVTAHYKALSLKNKSFDDERFVLDLAPYRGRYFLERKEMPELVDAARGAVKALNELVTGSPLSVVTQDRAVHEHEQDEEWRDLDRLDDKHERRESDAPPQPGTSEAYGATGRRLTARLRRLTSHKL